MIWIKGLYFWIYDSMARRNGGVQRRVLIRDHCLPWRSVEINAILEFTNTWFLDFHCWFIVLTYLKALSKSACCFKVVTNHFIYLWIYNHSWSGGYKPQNLFFLSSMKVFSPHCFLSYTNLGSLCDIRYAYNQTHMSLLNNFRIKFGSFHQNYHFSVLYDHSCLLFCLKLRFTSLFINSHKSGFFYNRVFFFLGRYLMFTVK